MSMLEGYTPTFDPFGAHIPVETVDGPSGAVPTSEGATHAVAKVLGNPYVWVTAGIALLFILK